MATQGVTRSVPVGDTDVVRVGLGTNRLRRTPENEAFLREAVAAGIGMVDTAYTYAGGESEATIGSASSAIPRGVVVATKGGYAAGAGRPEVLRAQIEESLRRLRTDTIDLYYLHRVDPETPFEDSLGVLKDCQDAGTIRHAGISAVTVAQIERARRVLPIAAVQNHYSIVERRDDAVVDHCATEGIAFVPYFPLRDVRFPALARVAERHGATPAQIALAWLLQRSPTMLPIPGTLSIEHLRENLGALEIELSDDDVRSLG